MMKTRSKSKSRSLRKRRGKSRSEIEAEIHALQMSVVTSDDAAPSEDVGDEARLIWEETVAKKIRNHFCGLPPAEQGLQEKVIELAWKNLAWLGCKAASICEFLKDQGFNGKQATTIALVLEICKVQDRFVHAFSSDLSAKQVRKRWHHCGSTFSLRDYGREVKRSCVDITLRNPLDDDQANVLWPEEEWQRIIKAWQAGGPEKIIVDLIEKIDANAERCWDIHFTGHGRSVCHTLKPDVIFTLKGHHVTSFNTGVILCLESKGQPFDTDYAVGEAVQYGFTCLKLAGPAKRSIVIGVSDLKCVRWFRMSIKDDLSIQDNIDFRDYDITMSKTITMVRQSFCHFLISKPSDLGFDIGHPIYQKLMPAQTWKVIKFLGCGATSEVYEVIKCDESDDDAGMVVKIPTTKDASESTFDHEKSYLQQLTDIDGIPRCVGVIDNILCLTPVGQPISNISDIGTDAGLAALVDVLQTAHQKGIVHRDVRIDNIVIAKSLQNRRRKHLFLIDWGYAAECGACVQYCGGITTASNEVLCQCVTGSMVVYKECDDLVALVRTIYLLCYPEAYVELDKCNHRPAALLKFWKGRFRKESHQCGSIWEMAETAACQGEYERLKSYIKLLQLHGVLDKTA